MEMINGKILPSAVFYPSIVTSTWFKHWGLQCGKCKKDFHRFALFGEPKCPWCGTRNAPQFDTFC